MNEQTTPNRPGFADALVALGEHLRMCRDLPAVAQVSERFYRPNGFVYGLHIQLRDVAGLAMWAATLTNVTSEADRMKSGEVYGFVYGQLDTVEVCVWAGDLPSEAFPDEPGRHEWDVTALLQEA